MNNQIRVRAFQWLEEQVRIYGNVLPRKILEQGFFFRGKRITLIGPSGIWKPKYLDDAPISITTSPNGPYKDTFSKSGYLIYKYRGTDPFQRDNVGLRNAMKNQIPLIYFHGIEPGKYYVTWPIYVVGDNVNQLSFEVVCDTQYSMLEKKIELSNKDIFGEDATLYRKYVTREVKQRIHQSAFRERVLSAYDNQCAFCRLKHRKLLDASHIIPDSDIYGEPIVSNGLSLCKIHHAAFDKFFIGVTSEYKIMVRDDLLKERDGLMLKYGIQELQGKQIILPQNKKLRPDQNRLEKRYKDFEKHVI